jgi:hypothetical protein
MNSINLVELSRGADPAAHLTRANAMFPNRLRHLLSQELSNRFAAACPAAFVPVAVAACQCGWVQEVYRQAAEQTRVQLAPPRHLRPTVFSSN